jgi:Ca2+-transporting ATPase
MPALAGEAPPPGLDLAQAGEAWHRLDPDQARQRADSAPDGLDPAEAGRRLARNGRNELIEKGATSPLRLLWQQLTVVMVLILIAAAPPRSPPPDL